MRAIVLVPERGYAERWAWAYDVEAAALERGGLTVEPLPWPEAVGGVADADVIMPLVAWGYNRDYPRWLAMLDRAEAESWPMSNPPALLRWNGDKAYLAELGAKGIATLDTIEVAALDLAELATARRRFGSDEVVIKPPISGGSERTYRLALGDSIPDDVVGQRMIVQPFEPAIAQGEYSLILFGGELSHCVLKVPATGDYRVQPHLGGIDAPCPPPPGGLELARAALAAAPASALYARVDLLRRSDGTLALMELELIEPALFLHHAPDRGAAFASAVANWVRAQP